MKVIDTGSVRSRRFAAGFTLVELILVVVIIGVLAAMAVPRFLTFGEDAKTTEGKTVLRHLRTMQERHKVQYGSYTGVFAELEGSGDPVRRATFFEFRLRTAGDGFFACARPAAGHAYMPTLQINEGANLIELSSPAECTGNAP